MIFDHIFNGPLLRGLMVCALIFIITPKLICSLFSKATNRHHKLPPGPKGWPILGALPLLGSMSHVTLANMAKKFGPVMYMKVGTCGMVVASNPDAAKAFLLSQDINFSKRPSIAGPTHMGYNRQDITFGDYGPRWKLMRQLCSVHMLGGKAFEHWADIRMSELGHMLRAMYESSKRGESVAVREMLADTVANMLGQAVLSCRVYAYKDFKEMVVELMTLGGQDNIGDCIPSIAWMDLQGVEGAMKRLHKRFDALLTKMLEEHKASANDRKGRHDLLDFVTEISDTSQGERLNTGNVKGLLLNLIIAGTDTSSNVIEWGLAEMLKNPSILKRAQEEMDQVIGRKRRLMESDLPKLPYLKAICKETLRLHPPIPLNVPRIASQACEVNGYHIPKNTWLSVNIWAIGRDPDIWDNPLNFNPDRFLTGINAKIDLHGSKDLELIPFGAGRRICPAVRFSLVLVEYIMGTLMHSFDWKLPDEVIELNMDERLRIALYKAVPLKAMVSPRLPLDNNVA